MDKMEADAIMQEQFINSRHHHYSPQNQLNSNGKDYSFSSLNERHISLNWLHFELLPPSVVKLPPSVHEIEDVGKLPPQIKMKIKLIKLMQII